MSGSSHDFSDTSGGFLLSRSINSDEILSFRSRASWQKLKDEHRIPRWHNIASVSPFPPPPAQFRETYNAAFPVGHLTDGTTYVRLFRAYVNVCAEAHVVNKQRIGHRWNTTNGRGGGRELRRVLAR